MKKLFLTAALWLWVARCALAVDAPKPPVPMETLPPIEVQAGQQFTVTLDSNPTTGYSWDLAKPLDERIVRLIGTEFKRTETGLIGAGGKQVWTFKAVGAGKTRISLKYARPWEKDTLPVKAADVEVTVR